MLIVHVYELARQENVFPCNISTILLSGMQYNAQWREEKKLMFRLSYAQATTQNRHRFELVSFFSLFSAAFFSFTHLEIF